MIYIFILQQYMTVTVHVTVVYVSYNRQLPTTYVTSQQYAFDGTHVRGFIKHTIFFMHDDKLTLTQIDCARMDADLTTWSRLQALTIEWSATATLAVAVILEHALDKAFLDFLSSSTPV
jgi:hypothetical protein